MIDSAAARFLPTIMMWALPLVCRANASAIARPIPLVPPTKTATGRYGKWNFAFSALIYEMMGPFVCKKGGE